MQHLSKRVIRLTPQIIHKRHSHIHKSDIPRILRMNHFKELEKLLDSSYSPYSRFNVASLVIDKEGKYHKGVNVESASYSPTICAERNAIHTSITSGVKKGDICEIQILARRESDSCIVKAFPCGPCRQVIAELSNNKAKVFIYGLLDENPSKIGKTESPSNISVSEYSIAELLPYAFLGDELSTMEKKD